MTVNHCTLTESFVDECLRGVGVFAEVPLEHVFPRHGHHRAQRRRHSTATKKKKGACHEINSFYKSMHKQNKYTMYM